MVSGLKRGGVSKRPLRDQLRSCLRPQVKLGKPVRLRDDTDTAEVSIRLKDLVDWEIVLASDHAHVAIRDSSNELWRSSAYTLLSDFSDLLRQAFDLMNELDGAGEDTDFSYIHHPLSPSTNKTTTTRNGHPWLPWFERRGCKWRSGIPIAPS